MLLVFRAAWATLHGHAAVDATALNCDTQNGVVLSPAAYPFSPS